MKDVDFLKNYRMCRTTFQAFLTDVGPTFPERSSNNRKELIVPELLMTFLRFAGGNCRYLDSKVSYIGIHLHIGMLR